MSWDANRILSEIHPWLVIGLLLPALLGIAGCDKNAVTDTDDGDPFEEWRRYYPLTQGIEWVYDTSLGIRYTYTVVNSYTTGYLDSAEVLITGDGGVERWLMYWTYDKLFVTSSDSINQPKSYFLVPPDSGRTWETQRIMMPRSSYVAEATVYDTDSLVTVPAGTWEAVIVREIRTYTLDNDPTQVDTAWYAYAHDVGQLFLHRGSYEVDLFSITYPDTTGD